MKFQRKLNPLEMNQTCTADKLRNISDKINYPSNNGENYSEKQINWWPTSLVAEKVEGTKAAALRAINTCKAIQIP